jgi:predicted nucleic acid-binding protein
MSRPLPALPSGTLVLIDANIFIYGLFGESRQCADLIGRCRKEEVAGVTTIEVVAEVCHRLMVKEAMDLGLISRPAASALKSKHDAIRGLVKYWELTAQIFQSNLVVLDSNETRHRAAQRIRSEHGLLTNDSLIAAACAQHDIRALATRDADFELIPELTVYGPSDLRRVAI